MIPYKENIHSGTFWKDNALMRKRLGLDSNAHLGRDWLENDVNEQNVNGKLFAFSLKGGPS